MQINLDQITLPQRDLRASIDEDQLDELAASLRDHGQLQPIGVHQTENGTYTVVFGARRTRAARLLGWQTIRAEILDHDSTTTEAAAKLIENVQRVDLSPIEEAYGLLDLIQDGIADIRALQRQTGKSREWIKARLELAELPDDLQGAVQAGVISIGVARAFGSITNPTVREQYLQAAVDNGCTTDQARIWANQAQFSETGIVAMDKYGERSLTDSPPPQVVDQQYHCFICAELYSWRRVNTLVICGTCQDQIAAVRTNPQPPPLPYPIDNQLDQE